MMQQRSLTACGPRTSVATPHPASLICAPRTTGSVARPRTLLVARASDEQPQASESQPAPASSVQPAAPAAQSVSQPQSQSHGASIAVGAALSAVVAFAVTSLVSTGPSLATIENMAVPWEVALTNGKPTVLEFYANWCEVCNELVPMEYEVQKQYGDKVNFVMLNIENSKWAEEAREYRVQGIPHFVFLDGKGEPMAAAVGRLPKQVLEGNVSTLARGSSKLPFAAVREETSSIERPDGLAAPRQAQPRDHA